MTQPPNIQAFISLIHSEFRQGKKLTVRDLRKFAEQAGLTQDDKYLWEVTELAWVRWYRDIAGSRDKTRDVYDRIVQFYQEVQPTFTGTDSEKKVFQQYSTSGPIAYLAGWFTQKPDKHIHKTTVLEPSAGNGLLTIFYPSKNVTANEINTIRRGNLLGEGYAEVLDRDASQPLPSLFKHTFDAILTNPPFGALGEVNRDFGWGFRKLDHVMVGHALDCMKSDGRAAILIGGHTEFDEKSGVVRSGRAFFDWLCRHYRVVDMVNIDSAKLYAKQGTSYPLRLILVAGRKSQPFGFGTNRRDFSHFADVVGDFNELYRRVTDAREAAALPEVTIDDLLAREVGKIEMAL